MSQQEASLCRVPNTIPGMTIDPAKTVGAWYTYMFNSPGPVNYNMYFVYTPLGMVDGRLALSWYSSFWYLQPQRSCNAMFAQHYLGTNGVKSGTSYMSSAMMPPTPEPTTYTTIYTDYDNVEIVYRCMGPNNQTGICDRPLILVNTRVQPAFIPQRSQLAIRNQIYNNLNQYCQSDSMRAVVWDATLPACNPPALSTITRTI